MRLVVPRLATLLRPSCLIPPRRRRERPRDASTQRYTPPATASRVPHTDARDTPRTKVLTQLATDNVVLALNLCPLDAQLFLDQLDLNLGSQDAERALGSIDGVSERVQVEHDVGAGRKSDGEGELRSNGAANARA